jgi:hypothetical protein
MAPVRDNHRAPAKIGRNAMHSLHRRNAVSQRHLVWLLWLMLLLPVAQVTASWHALSHVETDASGARDPRHALHLTHCDLCLTAAAVDGGVPLAEPPALKPGVARHEVPQTAPVAFWVASPARAYLSRAPPIASC